MSAAGKPATRAPGPGLVSEQHVRSILRPEDVTDAESHQLEVLWADTGPVLRWKLDVDGCLALCNKCWEMLTLRIQVAEGHPNYLRIFCPTNFFMDFFLHDSF